MQMVLSWIGLAVVGVGEHPAPFLLFRTDSGSLITKGSPMGGSGAAGWVWGERGVVVAAVGTGCVYMHAYE